MVQYVPSGKYLARIRVRGKLIRQSLATKVLSAPSSDSRIWRKPKRLLAENATEVGGGDMTVGDALKTYRMWLHGDRSLNPRTKVYREECIIDLLRTWARPGAAGACRDAWWKGPVWAAALRGP